MSQFSFPEVRSSIFELHTQPQLFYLRHFGGRDAPKPPQALHTHQDLTELLFIEEGTGKYMVDHQVYNVHKGDLLLLNANILHGLCEEGSSKIQACQLGIRRLHLKGLEPDQLIAPDICPVLPTGPRLPLLLQFFRIFDALIQEPQPEQLGETANHTLQALITLIHQLLLKSGKALPQGQDYNLGLRIKEYIDAHYLEDLKLASIAEALHVNPYYLSHTFKKILGYSPIQYMIHRRIGEAQNLLINTDYTITEIALRCGYNNSNYFQVVFNTIVGMPPGKYRKSWRQ